MKSLQTVSRSLAKNTFTNEDAQRIFASFVGKPEFNRAEVLLSVLSECYPVLSTSATLVSLAVISEEGKLVPKPDQSLLKKLPVLTEDGVAQWIDVCVMNILVGRYNVRVDTTTRWHAYKFWHLFRKILTDKLGDYFSPETREDAKELLVKNIESIFSGKIAGTKFKSIPDRILKEPLALKRRRKQELIEANKAKGVFCVLCRSSYVPGYPQSRRCPDCVKDSTMLEDREIKYCRKCGEELHRKDYPFRTWMNLSVCSEHR